MDKRFPLISCLCVSRNPTVLLRRAVECFRHQHYPNKELIIVYEKGHQSTAAYLEELNTPDIFSYPLKEDNGYSLGEKRNYAVGQSRGEYFCQWDDDDWYHPDRLTDQLEPVLRSHKSAGILVYEIVFDMLQHQAYSSTIRPQEHSILCRRSVWEDGVRYSHKNRGEDYDFIRLLLDRRLILPIINPSLYIYVYHGNNSFGGDHFNNIFAFSDRLADPVSVTVGKILTNELSAHEGAAYLKSLEFLQPFHYFNRFPFK